MHGGGREVVAKSARLRAGSDEEGVKIQGFLYMFFVNGVRHTLRP